MESSNSSSDKNISIPNLSLGNKRLNQQYESYILNMRADKLLDLYSSRTL